MTILVILFQEGSEVINYVAKVFKLGAVDENQRDFVVFVLGLEL